MRIGVIHARQTRTYLDFNAQFLADLAHQAFGQGFTGLLLAPGKFPQAAEHPLGRPLGN